MLLNAGIDSVSVEVISVIGVLIGFVALILVFFLYINRKLCFHTARNLHRCVENTLPSSGFHHIARRGRCENTSSDSEDEILRHLKSSESCSIETGSKYGINHLSPATLNLGFSGLQHITITPSDALKDPLGIAERGKVGIPSSQSECSSNESSVDSNLVNESKQDRIQNMSMLKCTEARILSMKETRIGNHPEKKINRNSFKYKRMLCQSQDTLDCLPDINSSVTQDCIVFLAQEPLSDTSDIKSENDIQPLSTHFVSGRRGSIEIALLYDAPMRKMTVHVLQAKGIPSRNLGQQTHTQVRLLMLPTKKQKHKTKIKSGENPQFMESFLLHRVNPEEVNSMGLRIRVYGCERMRKERLIGEAIVNFGSIDLELETILWLTLEPRNNYSIIASTSDLLSLTKSDSTASTTSMQHGGVPELLLGLSYSGTTGRLTVEIVKGSHFRNLTLHKAPDTYVKLCLVNSIGQEMARTKSSTRRGQPNPLFKETFVFQVALFQLNDVTLMISVYAKRSMKRNEMVGWFSLGLNSSGPEEMAHWVDMREGAKGEMLARWHILVDS